MADPSPQAEYIVACRSCGNHCLAVERVLSVPVDGEVVYSDGYLGGWQQVQTEVVTCPHCKLVMSWRKTCEPADRLRRAGDLERFNLLPAGWGPASLYWTGFDQFDAAFHHKGMGGDALPRLLEAPEAGSLGALRKRGALARGLLWLDNDRERQGFLFGGRAPPPKRSTTEERQRALLLRALLEAARFGGEASDQNVLDTAEWYREMGEWKASAQALDHPFTDPVLRDRARQMLVWIKARNAVVQAFEEASVDPPAFEPAPVATPAPAPAQPAAFELDFATMAPPASAPAAAAPEPEPPEPDLPEPDPEPAAPQPMEFAPPEPPLAAAPPAAADAQSPRMLLETLLEVLGTLPAETLTRKYIPAPHGDAVRGQLRAHGWDEETFAVSLIRGFARQHGWPADVDPGALSDLESFGVDDEELLDYLAASFTNASWEHWAFDVPGTAAPKRGK